MSYYYAVNDRISSIADLINTAEGDEKFVKAITAYIYEHKIPQEEKLDKLTSTLESDIGFQKLGIDMWKLKPTNVVATLGGGKSSFTFNVDAETMDMLIQTSHPFSFIIVESQSKPGFNVEFNDQSLGDGVVYENGIFQCNEVSISLGEGEYNGTSVFSLPSDNVSATYKNVNVTVVEAT